MLTIVVTVKRQASGGLSESAVATGTSHLKTALERHEESEYDKAEAEFRKAASVSVVDYYPAFLIQTGRRLRTKHFSDAPPGQEEILKALSSQDWALAREESVKLGRFGSKPRIFYERLTDDLSR